MANKDGHFWIKDVINRLPVELLPKIPTWSNLLSSITQLKTERNNAVTDLEEANKVIRRLEKRASDLKNEKDRLIGMIDNGLGWEDVSN